MCSWFQKKKIKKGGDKINLKGKKVQRKIRSMKSEIRNKKEEKMKKLVGFIIVVTLCVSSAVILKSWAKNRPSQEKNIVIEINYGNEQLSRTIEIPWKKGKTVLEILQKAAVVETHPVGEYIMVTSIDGVKGKRGDMAWYYTINGKSANKIAYSKITKADEHIQWSYKKDVCSSKVDKGIN